MHDGGGCHALDSAGRQWQEFWTPRPASRRPPSNAIVASRCSGLPGRLPNDVGVSCLRRGEAREDVMSKHHAIYMRVEHRSPRESRVRGPTSSDGLRHSMKASPLL